MMKNKIRILHILAFVKMVDCSTITRIRYAI